MPVRAGLDHATVVRAAADLADEQGLDTVTLGAVAARLGVQPPSLYNHVRGVAGLRDGLALLATRELGTRITRSAVGKSADDAILAVGRAYRAFAHEHPGLFAASARAPSDDPAWQTAARQVVETIIAVLAAYNLSQTDALHAVRVLRGLVHGFVAIEATGGFGIPLDQDASLDYGLRLFARGLAAASQGR
jgi:AcrR family transcriptional regulator